LTADTEPPEVRAYLPAHEAPALRNVQAGSAIVSQHEPVEISGALLVYFEDNKHGASNMATYPDRAMFARWRMCGRYPTVAQAKVPVDQPVRIGTDRARRRRARARPGRLACLPAGARGPEESLPSGAPTDRPHPAAIAGPHTTGTEVSS
jgi:hypothetical protein